MSETARMSVPAQKSTTSSKKPGRTVAPVGLFG